MILKSIKEKRYINSANARAKAIEKENESDERFIEGYAALFNQRSKLLAEYRDNELVEFYETIESGAFDDVLADPELNVIMTVDHDRSKMVARTLSGTLQLSVDEVGLKYRFSVPNTTLGNDLYELVKRGDLFESSFVFTIDPDDEELSTGVQPIERTIKRFSGLYDTSIVTDGAYANTSITVSRSITDVIEKQKEVEVKVVENDAELMDIDIYLIENDFSY